MSASNASTAGPRTFRAWSGPVILVLTVLAALFLLGDAVVRAGWGQALLLAPWVLLVVWVIYETSAASSVRIDDDGVVVQNMLRRTSFGWGRVKDIDLRWQLVFALDDGSDLACWGGPARARPRRRPDDDGATAAGLREFTEISDRRASSFVDGGAIRRGWDVPALVALVVIVVWAAISVALANS